MNDVSPNNLVVFYCVSLYRYENIFAPFVHNPRRKKEGPQKLSLNF